MRFKVSGFEVYGLRVWGLRLGRCSKLRKSYVCRYFGAGFGLLAAVVIITGKRLKDVLPQGPGDARADHDMSYSLNSFKGGLYRGLCRGVL